MRRTLTLALFLVLPIAGQAQAARERLEGQMQQQMVRLMRVQLGLTDAQIGRVQEVRTRIDAQTRAIGAQEGKLRNDLRDEVTIGDTTRNAAVRDLLDRIVKLQRQRAELAESEYKDLAAVLSPMQHARFIGLQEVLRKRINQMIQAAADSGEAIGGRGARGGNGRRVPPV
jgi:hypothetical protein